MEANESCAPRVLVDDSSVSLGAGQLSSPDADVDAAVAGARPIIMIDGTDRPTAITLAPPSLTSIPDGTEAEPSGHFASPNPHANKETALHLAASEVEDKTAAVNGDVDMLQLGSPLPFCEESDEEQEVFFGEIGCTEQKKQNKYCSRPTAVFSAGFRQDPRLMRYTNFMYTIDQSLLESVTEEEESGREDVNGFYGHTPTKGQIMNTNSPSQTELQTNERNSDNTFNAKSTDINEKVIFNSENMKAVALPSKLKQNGHVVEHNDFNVLDINLQKLKLQDADESACDADVSHLSDDDVYSPVKPATIIVCDSLVASSDSPTVAQNEKEEVNNSENGKCQNKLEDVKNNNDKHLENLQDDLSITSSNNIETQNNSLVVSSTPVRPFENDSNFTFSSCNGVTPIKPTELKITPSMKTETSDALSESPEQTIVKTPLVVFKESHFSPTVFRKTPICAKENNSSSAKKLANTKPFVFKEPGFSPTVKATYCAGGNKGRGYSAGSVSPQCDIITVSACDVDTSLSQYISSTHIFSSTDEDSSDDEDVFVTKNRPAVSVNTFLRTPPSVKVELNSGNIDRVINSPLKLDDFAFPVRGGRDSKEKAVCAKNLIENVRGKKSSSSVSSSCSDDVKICATKSSMTRKNGTTVKGAAQKSTKSTPVLSNGKDKVTQRPSGRRIITAQKSPRNTVTSQPLKNSQPTTRVTRTAPAKTTPTIKATKRATPSSARAESPACVGPVYRNGTPRYPSLEKGSSNGSGPSPAKRTAPPPKFSLADSPPPSTPNTDSMSEQSLEDKKKRLEKIREDKKRLQLKISNMSCQMKTSVKSASTECLPTCSPRSPLTPTSADNLPRVRYKDIHAIHLKDQELEAVTRLHTLCNSQQISKLITKAHAHASNKHKQPSREASRLQWQQEVVSDVNDPSTSPVHSPSEEDVKPRRSILLQREPGFTYPYDDLPSSPVVIRKVARRTNTLCPSKS